MKRFQLAKGKRSSETGMNVAWLAALRRKNESRAESTWSSVIGKRSGILHLASLIALKDYRAELTSLLLLHWNSRGKRIRTLKSGYAWSIQIQHLASKLACVFGLEPLPFLSCPFLLFHPIDFFVMVA